MISEWSCDTEDRNKWHFKLYLNRNQLFKIITQYYYFYCIFDQINAALVDFF